MSDTLANKPPVDKSVLSLLVQDRFGVLTKVSTLFGQRGCNIHSLTVSPTHVAGFSHITVTIHEEASRVTQIRKQLAKLEDVRQVNLVAPGAKERALARIWLNARGSLPLGGQDPTIRVEEHDDGSFFIEAMGDPSDIDRLIAALPQESIEALSRSGSTVLDFFNS
jgi:acetolactate synthase-1/3 small subunit